MKKIVIHPGFGKAGTTSVQNFLFGVHPGILNLGRPYNACTRKLCDLLVDNLGYYDQEALNAQLTSMMTDYKDGQTVILSDETFSSSIYANQIIARRMKELFPQAKIFFTIRNQFTALESCYAAHGRHFKDAPAPYNDLHITFDNWLDYSLKTAQESYLGLVRYRPLIQYFAELFGRENVHVLLFEEYVHERENFARKLAEIIEINAAEILEYLKDKKANERGSQREVSYRAFRQKFLPGFHPLKYLPFGKQISNMIAASLKKGSAVKVKISGVQAQKLTLFYKEDNRKLAQEYNLDLQKWGYPL